MAGLGNRYSIPIDILSASSKVFARVFYQILATKITFKFKDIISKDQHEFKLNGLCTGHI